MKVRISESEAYPIFFVDVERGEEDNNANIPEELYYRYINNYKEYQEIQNELAKIETTGSRI